MTMTDMAADQARLGDVHQLADQLLDRADAEQAQLLPGRSARPGGPSIESPPVVGEPGPGTRGPSGCSPVVQ